MIGSCAQTPRGEGPVPRRVAGPLAAAAALAAAACTPANGPLMDPGADCLGCHTGGSGAKRWTVAGTIYEGDVGGVRGPAVKGANVTITDANAWTFQLRTNDAGNFYTAEPVVFPLKVCVDRHGTNACMDEPVPAGMGSCNVCHGPGGVLEPVNHARLFPIDSASSHAALGCLDCHTSFSSPAPASFRCAECHLSRDPGLGTSHTLSTSNAAIVVTEFAPASDACLRCHADGQVAWTANHPSGFDGAPPHRDGATCLVCHDVFRTDKPWAGDFGTDPRSWPVGSGHGCVHCHTTGVPNDNGG